MPSACPIATINVASLQARSTINEADAFRPLRHDPQMLGHAELLEEIRRLRDNGKTSNAEIGRLLGVPSSRVADIFATDRTPRLIKLDEAKILIEHFGLGATTPTFTVPSADVLMPLLHALSPLVPPGRLTEQSLRALSEALSYGLELLGDHHATSASSDAIGVAARAAASRFREIATA